MNSWIKVVTHPLGLGGFALFLICLYIRRIKKSDEQRWPSRLAAASAVIALLGGLILAYREVPRTAIPPQQVKQPAPQQQQTNQVRQETSGSGSPAVQGVQGEVNITIDQSKDKTEAQKPDGKKAKAAPQ